MQGRCTHISPSPDLEKPRLLVGHLSVPDRPAPRKSGRPAHPLHLSLSGFVGPINSPGNGAPILQPCSLMDNSGCEKCYGSMAAGFGTHEDGERRSPDSSEELRRRLLWLQGLWAARMRRMANRIGGN